MEIEDLRTFVEVADAGGINSAARRLGLAKSIVSRRLLRLEEELGAELLARTTRGAVLTEAGISFRDQAADICAKIDAAREEMSPNGDIRGLLRIAGPASVGTYFASVLADLARRHPALNVHTRFSDQYVDLAAEGFDCGIRVGYMPDSNLIARKIGSLPVRLYASPDYIAENGAPEYPGDILKHAAITAGTNSWVFSDGDQSFTVNPQGRFRADNAYVLTEAAAAGLGILAMGAMIAEPYVQDGRLVPIMTRFTLPDVGIFVVRPPSQHTPRKVRVLIDLMVERFASGRF
ncbi:LysR substrate-binding domain-containing protein [Kaistia dalseonensis]|uniref:DNA-binding transcriptional LysR family regulator n=1 Tax=Kaistia dalseonensis TaxID=410840 RepID=A0ABU0H361_9HYPH|nr:LysR family transcriptional regulator [Kaistia dalseonensis]MCX5493927.1 LysR substrate-binding domain-containing protein [Kaistia dalseonensis]MDQ0436497.1 DNA-binding transcriptional LysR family regulator [Kaistia dalseonensis]